MGNLDLLLEAERRGLLPPDKQNLLNEARSRGLVGGTPPKPEETTSGFTGAFGAGIASLKGETALTLGKLGLMKPEEAEAYRAKQEEEARKFKPTEKGWTEAPFEKLKELAGGSAAYMAVPLAAAGATALAPEALAAVGATGLAEAIGGAGITALGARIGLPAIASFGTNTAQFTGSNLARQLDSDEGKKLADTSLLKAGATAIPQSLLDTGAMHMIPGVRKIFGQAGINLSTEAAEQVAKKGLLSTAGEYGKVIGKTAGTEGITETGQAFLERLQAGLNLTDPEARKEYYENFIGGAVLGGAMGGAGHLYEKTFPDKEPTKPGEPQVEAPPPPEQSKAAEPLKLGYNPPVEDVVEKDPLQNPVGNFMPNELTPDIVKFVNNRRKEEGKPKLKAFSIEDLVEAGAPPQEVDRLLAYKNQFDGSVTLAPEDVKNKAQEKNVDTETKGFTDFLRRATGQEDLTQMSQPQLHSAFKSLDSLEQAPELRILPEGTNAIRFTDRQYEKGLRGLGLKLGETPAIGRASVIQEIKDFTGLENDHDANVLLRTAIRNGDLESTRIPQYEVGKENDDGEFKVFYVSNSREAAKRSAGKLGYTVRDGFREEIGFPGEATQLPGGPDIRMGMFKQGDKPEGYDIKAGSKHLAVSNNEDEANEKAARLSVIREQAAKDTQKKIEELGKQILASQNELERLEATGQGHSLAFSQRSAQVHAANQGLVNQTNELQKLLNSYREPVTVTATKSVKPIVRNGYTFFENNTAVASFPTQQQAEQFAVSRLDDEKLTNIVKTGPTLKGLMPKRLAKIAEKELASRGRIEPGIEVEFEGTAEEAKARLAKLGIFSGELQSKIAELEKALLPALRKLGLEGVGLNVVREIKNNAEGNYAAKVIQIALDNDPGAHLGVLRHESIHALKELGAFTNKEWAVLNKQAKEVWVPQYMKNRATIYKGKRTSLYDAYQDIYKDDKKTLNGFNEYIQEEAIAEAFRHWKPQAGTFGNLGYRLSKFFAALKNAFKGLGFQTSESVFEKVEAGEAGARLKGLRGESNQAKPTGKQNAEERKSLRPSEPTVRPSGRGDEGIKPRRGRGLTGPSFEAPLQGAPSVPSVHGPDPRIVAVAERVAARNGIPFKRQSEYVKVDSARGKRLADAYEEMKHEPQNPAVKEAYQNLIKQTKEQYQALVDAGYKFWFVDLDKPSNLEYISSPWNAMRDLRQNQEMGVFATDDGFGTSDFDPKDNPLFEQTEYEWPVGGLDGPKKRVLANDLFRAVHDAFGHGIEGAGFRADGEENAWQAHSRLFTGSAVAAITSETRGQNSWVNFGPYAEANRTANGADTHYADQKVGLLPEWAWTEGVASDEPDFKELDSKKDAKMFRDAVDRVKRGRKNSFPLHVHDIDTYKNARLFLSEDKESGFALIGDEIGSFFSGGKGQAYPTLRFAVEQGGRRIDAYRTVMPTVLGKAGFRPVARVEFNPEFATDIWDYNKFKQFQNGKPDLVFFAYDPTFKGDGQEEAAKAPLVEYQEALDLQQQGLKRYSLKPIVLGKKQEDAQTFNGVHYGKQKVANLNGGMYGSGIRGEEARRVAQSRDPRVKKRVYFYVPNDRGNMNRPEAGLGQHVYTQTFGNILGPGDTMRRLNKESDGPNEFESAVVDAGYDGYAVPNMGMMVILNHNVPVKYEGLAPELRAQGKLVDNKVKYSLRKISDQGLYSALLEEVENAPFKEQTAEGWKNYIKGLINKGAIKREQVEWENFNGMVDSWTETKKVPKWYVLNSLNEQPQLEEKNNSQKYKGWVVGEGESDNASNYREIVLSLPDTETEYSHGHWHGVQNPVGHIRLTDRLDSEGNPVLFVEELQSDWGQEGGKKGFKKALKPGFEITERHNDQIVVDTPSGNIKADKKWLIKDLENYAKNLRRLSIAEYVSARIVKYIERANNRTFLKELSDLTTSEYDVIDSDDLGEGKGYSASWFNNKTEEYEYKNNFITRDEAWKYIYEHVKKPEIERIANFIFDKHPIVSTVKVLIDGETYETAEIYDQRDIDKFKERNETIKIVRNVEPERFVAKREFAVLKDGEEVGRVNENGKKVKVRYGSMEEAEQAAKKIGGEAKDMGYGENTQGWVTLLLKRVFTEAAKGNYKKVAFVKGEQPAKYYNMSNVVDEISYDPVKKRLWGYRNDDAVFSEEVESYEKIAEYIGQELADKIKAKVEDNASHGDTFSDVFINGVDFEMGGEGLKTFYDKIVPNILKPLLKKYGTELKTVELDVAESKSLAYLPGKVIYVDGSDSSDLPRGLTFNEFVESYQDEQEDLYTEQQTGKQVTWIAYRPEQFNKPTVSTQIGFDVTPEFKKKVEGGQPLYSLRANLSPALNARIDATTGQRNTEGFMDRILSILNPETRAKLRAGFIFQFEALERGTKARAERYGNQEYLADVSATAAALESMRSKQIVAAAMRDGVPVYRNGFTTTDNFNGTQKGLLEIFSPLAATGDPDVWRCFQFYAGSKRGARLDAEGREHLFKQPDVQLANNMAAQFAQSGIDFDAVYQEYQKWNKALVKYMQDTGVLTAADAAYFTRFGDYIPFYRQMEGEATVGPKIFSAIAGVQKPKALKGGTEKLGDFLENVIRNASAAVESGMKNVAANRGIRDALDLGTAHQVPVPNQDTVSIKENGVTKHYELDDRLLFEAFKGLNVPRMPWVQILAKPADILRNFVTKDPGFILANIMRDSVSAWVTSGSDMRPVIDSFKQFGKILANKSPEAVAMARAGLGGYEFKGSLKDSAESFEKALRAKTGTRTKTEKALLPVTALWEMLEHGSNASDMATRAEIYKRVLAETGNEAEALFQASEVMNFSRKGNFAVMQAITALVPFMNARIQGMDVLYRSGFGKAANANKERMQKAFIIRSLSILTLSTLYWWMVHDDDEYKKLTKEERDGYWIVPGLKVNGKPFRFPIPFEIGVVFKVLPERIAEVWVGQDTPKDFRESITRNILDTLKFNPIPQAFIPIAENITNHSFFTGEKIVGRGLENVAKPLQYNASTSLFARELGEATGMSPIQIENIIRGYTGTMGMYAVNMLDSFFSTQDTPVKATMRAEQLPVIKRFFASDAGTVAQYYELKDEVDEVVRTVNFLLLNDPDKLEDYLKENENTYMLRDFVSSIEKDMKQIREYRNAVNADKDIGADEKREILDELHDYELALTSDIKAIRKEYH
jgi:Large polyvalent protein associated domain 38